MARWTAQKRDVLDALGDDFLHNYGKGRTLLAVDGLAGSGSARFADDFAERLGRGGHAVFRASIGDFQRPRALADARDTAEGYYHDTFDYSAFRRVLIEPFRMGGSAGFVTAAFDAARDAAVEMQWLTGPQDATLVVDGLFLQRAELRGLWNYSVWLDADDEAVAARLFDLYGAAGRRAKYAAGEKLYLKDAKPRAAASAILDNTDRGASAQSLRRQLLAAHPLHDVLGR